MLTSQRCQPPHPIPSKPKLPNSPPPRRSSLGGTAQPWRSGPTAPRSCRSCATCPRYNKTRCFDPFPFPAAIPAQAAEIAALAEELDALRKTRLAAHPRLTLTTLYNVLAALRAGQPLSPAERDVLDAGQVEVLRHLHDRLDAAVAAAYGWPADLSADAIVERVVTLNRERAAEEAAGQVRWLRPTFQVPADADTDAASAARREQLALPTDSAAVLPSWPKLAPDQFTTFRAALKRHGPATSPGSSAARRAARSPASWQPWPPWAKPARPGRYAA